MFVIAVNVICVFFIVDLQDLCNTGTRYMIYRSCLQSFHCMYVHMFMSVWMHMCVEPRGHPRYCYPVTFTLLFCFFFVNGFLTGASEILLSTLPQLWNYKLGFHGCRKWSSGL